MHLDCPRSSWMKWTLIRLSQMWIRGAPLGDGGPVGADVGRGGVSPPDLGSAFIWELVALGGKAVWQGRGALRWVLTAPPAGACREFLLLKFQHGLIGFIPETWSTYSDAVESPPSLFTFIMINLSDLYMTILLKCPFLKKTTYMLVYDRGLVMVTWQHCFKDRSPYLQSSSCRLIRPVLWRLVLVVLVLLLLLLYFYYYYYCYYYFTSTTTTAITTTTTSTITTLLLLLLLLLLIIIIIESLQQHWLSYMILTSVIVIDR